MPADVETMFSAREVPWHRIGEVTEGALTAQAALETAGLDWSVDMKPLRVYMGHDARPQYVTVDDRFGVVRDSDSKVLGVVGTSYVPLQNREAFAFFDNLVDSGDAKYETAGSLRGGKWVFMTARMPETMSVGGVDDVDLYILLTSSHDGSRAVTAAVTPVRVVCTNTLNMALGAARQTWKVRHTTTAQARIQEARETLGLTFKFMEDFEAEAEAMLAKTVTEAEFGRMVEALLKDTPQAKDADAIRELFADAPNLDNVRGTAWGAFQAVVEYADWYRPYRTPEAQVLSLTDGFALKLKARAKELITS